MPDEPWWKSASAALNWGTPAGLGWGAAYLWDRNLFLGVVLASGLTCWVAANATSWLLIAYRNVLRFRHVHKENRPVQNKRRP